ncbi:MAG TPA: helix-turn-helix transcriptional regulator [Streptosporangiaceae bacterium]|nr:helix-turn-helix transcriptional regulator [Streptosporangiaceae bacterium]
MNGGESGSRPSNADAQALKGHLDVLLLAVLEDGPRHGYAVKEALREGSDGRFDLPTGTVYPALYRLEREGLITGTWSRVDGRRRRTYQLTPAGHLRLRTDRGHWREFAATISTLLEGKPWPATG